MEKNVCASLVGLGLLKPALDAYVYADINLLTLWYPLNIQLSYWCQRWLLLI